MLTEKIDALQQKGSKPNILVIGDLMIDHYITGGASRLSPEAPVPIVNLKSETNTLGGAGNVVQNLVSLGANVMVGGVIGDDIYGQQLCAILDQEGVSADTILVDNTRTTTVKTRVLAGSHQLLRIDREVTANLSAEMEDELFAKLSPSIESADIVLLSDYNKGLFSRALTQRIINFANSKNKKVIIDPKGLDYTKYKGAYLIKPNRKELGEAAKAERIDTFEAVQQAAKVIFAQTETEYLVVTLSEEGMAVISELAYKLLPVKATAVFDVTGAGDTVLATVAYFLASGFEIDEACELANHAAAIVIKEIGSATTTIDAIKQHILNRE
ncbi:D-glycero-beta-D-manno-heptose-7-phosphate kinase [Mucilaginibacter limnophilus]|uniref:D-glycero-beta-D-manno-heptose-7-phosphate kinase n=1 Tax=Mucilaginibacter limnophilus TaxID=1932778 RepID=A0A437MKF0_9SPHI|nr:D-glycero-beta-D-manno-heptose-7-phosphate kinase [Mucilaginibacter limnophilus]RVT98075.1 D-glycero-beta-D-manno-heptose-7-phosphate kinase [Mucilaginibacter limnophilus]